MALDPTKLTNARPVAGGGFIAQCPACAESGNDLSGKNHLRIFPDGSYGCAVDRSDSHYSRIHALAGINADPSAVSPLPPEPKLEVDTVWPASILERLVKDTSYWNGRGISDATLAPFRGGVAMTGQLANRYVFPVFSENGDIIGFNGRRIDGKHDKPWKLLGPSSRFLWGGLEEIEAAGRAILVESIGDSLMLREHGVPESICLFGTNMSQTVVGHLITINPSSIIVSTNLDIEKIVNGRLKRPGQEAALRIKRTLDAFFDDGVVSILHPEGAKDWGASSSAQIHAAFLESAPNPLAPEEQA